MLALLVGCGGGGGGGQGPAESELLSPGEGETNEEMLWPLRAGASWNFQPQATKTGASDILGYTTALVANVGSMPMRGYFALPAREMNGETTIAISSITEGSSDDTLTPELPNPIAWWSAGPEGTFLHATSRKHRQKPARFLPAVGRPGMAWRVWDADGGARYDVELGERRMADTIFGRRPVWRLRHHDADANYVDAFGCIVDRGLTFETEIIEGRGPARLDTRLRGGAPVLGAVVPLEPQTPAKVPSNPIKPVPVKGGAPLAIQTLGGYMPTGISAVQRVGEDVPSQLIVYGVGLTTELAGGINGGPAATQIKKLPMESCLTYSEADGINVVEDCLAPLGVLVPSTGGDPHLIPVWPRQAAAQPWPYGEYACNPTRDRPYTCHDFVLSGIFEGLDGTVYSIAGTSGFVVAGKHDPSRLYDSILEPKGFGRFLRDGGAMRFMQATNAGAVIGTRVGMHLGIGVMDWDAGTVRSSQVATRLDGSLGVLARPGGHDFIRASAGGRVEKILLEPGGVRIEHLVDVALNDNEILAGAIPWGDEILVLTHHNFEGGGEANDENPDGVQCGAPLVLPTFGEGRLGTVRPTPAEPAADSPFYGLRYEQQGADMMVCAPEISGPANLDDWQLGSAAARTYDLGEGCTLAVRDGQIGATFDLRDFETIVDVPGAGRAAIGLMPSEQTFEFPTCAPLVDGGCVSESGVYVPGFVERRSAPGRYEPVPGGPRLNRLGNPIADLVGQGLWAEAIYGGPDDVVGVRFIGRDDAFLAEGFSAILGPVAGGGVAAQRPDLSVVHLKADQTETPFAIPPDVGIPKVFFADGTVCGVTAPEMIRPDQCGYGPAVTRAWAACSTNGGEAVAIVGDECRLGESPSWLPIDPSTIYLVSEFAVSKVTVATGELQPIDLDAFGFDAPRGSAITFASAMSPVGEAFVLARIDTGFTVHYELAELRADGPHRIEVPRLGAVPADAPLEFAVDADFFIFHPGLREPRN